MLKDIESRDDIIELVNSFYKKVEVDNTIGYIFSTIAQVDWAAHLPVMYDFWESILFGVATYKGQPIVKHIMLNRKEPLKSEHFDRWIQLWESNVDQHFQGEKADEAKSKARTIKAMIAFKIKQSEGSEFIQ